MRAAILILATTLVAGSAFAQGATGNWSGTYNYSIQLAACSNRTYASTGNVSLTLLQTGLSISGRMDITNFLLFAGTCNPTAREVTTVIVGTASGSNVTWGLPNDFNGTRLSGTISGNAMTVQWSDDNGGTGSMQLTRTPADAPVVDMTGSWTGSYSFVDHCAGGTTATYTGPFTLAAKQTGNTVSGVVTMNAVPLYDQNCRTQTTLTMTMSVAGSVSGSTFTGGVFEPSGQFDFPITANLTSASMTGTVTGASATNTTGSFNLSRTNSDTPVSAISGTYEGTYEETDNEVFTCVNIGSLTFDGPASLALVQAGNVASGWLTFHESLDVSADAFGTCVVVNVGDAVYPVYGPVTNNNITLTLPLGGGAVVQFTVTVNGDNASGGIADSFGDQASFSATKTSTAVVPAITSFTASPTAVATAQPATLTWTTTNATSVSIDNGIGPQPVNGSVIVTPTTTTTYTLTATGTGGSVSAQTSVTVFVPPPKRRVVRR